MADKALSTAYIKNKITYMTASQSRMNSEAF